MADRVRKRVLELERRRLGHGEDRVLFSKMRERERERERDCVWWILWVVGSGSG